MVEARRWLVRGRVQGVGYRDFVRREANLRTLTGWVRNLEDGRVEAFAQGLLEDLDAFETALWKGPRLADVRAVLAMDAASENVTSEFEVR
ncbi:MAG: acylphosphatase [Acidobacteria bacterium]|nr:acylphosphatase [Acidobacteriota bacterium]